MKSSLYQSLAFRLNGLVGFLEKLFKATGHSHLIIWMSGVTANWSLVDDLCLPIHHGLQLTEIHLIPTAGLSAFFVNLTSASIMPFIQCASPGANSYSSLCCMLNSCSSVVSVVELFDSLL